MENLILLGPGNSLNKNIKKIRDAYNKKTLSLHRVFPQIHILYGVIPDYWTWADPAASIEGLQYILKNLKNCSEISKMKIILPHYMCETYEVFRQFSGTTRLGKNIELWKNYEHLLSEVKKKIEVKIVQATTTKFIALFPEKNLDYLIDINGEDFFVRFLFEKPVFGTVKYDSEQVIVARYKWGIENKVSSFMFPLAYHLGAKNVFCVGFDFIGGRFYDNKITKTAWGSEVREINDSIRISLGMVKKWILEKKTHGMNIYSLARREDSLLNLEVPFFCIENLK